MNLFEKTILKIGKENVVQVVTDNVSENKKAGEMLKGVFPHIFWTPCAAHCINLMFGDIFKEAPYSTAGHILNPGLYYKNNEMKTLTEEVWLGYHACVERMILDKTLQDKIGDELGVYMKAHGLLGIESAIRARTLRSPGEHFNI
ncbi:uncharacterized protein LOC129880814 [Solanum dulcamara]|uniref:uncharacterized protein LOC129880814 n=1 Tax=Solanum dulcamara TaxID=45834 RepID=UPI0024864FCE|nr:uncharacterized protein LOC129880814 [Solanum dulcamara]